MIAVVEAPPGSRVRRRRDEHGADQLVVPLGRSLWDRLFGQRMIIPTKYLIGDVRRGAYGLALVQEARRSEAMTG